MLNSGRLIESQAMCNAKARFNALSNPTRLFLSECVEPSPDDHILRSDLYRAYKDWCAFQKIKPLSAHRLYAAAHETLNIATSMSNGRRIFRDVRLSHQEYDDE